MAGIPIDKITVKSGMSRSHIYEQKEKVINYAESLNEQPEGRQTIEVTDALKKRLILSMALDCASSLEGIQRVLETALGIYVSIGYISGVIKEASKRAQAFDDQITLEGIRQGANDEIFQCSLPILTGIDPESTYIYLLEDATDRTGETWEIYMQDRKEHGLELETSINDGGAGLLAGIPKVYPEIDIQRDVFHALYEMGKEVSKVERKAYSYIKEEYALSERAEGKNLRQKTKERLAEIQPKTEAAIDLFDTISILLGWLKELLGFSGYSIEETTALIEYILNEIEKKAADYPGLIKEAKKVRRNLPGLLSFISRLTREMGKRAQELGIPPDVFHQLYRQMSCSPTSQQSNEIDCRLAERITEQNSEVNVRTELQKLLNGVKKASSLVENLNGRIRVYIDMKRVVPSQFFVLMKVYFNTRRYRRSRCKERIGKSPLELLTGKPQPEFLEALGF